MRAGIGGGRARRRRLVAAWPEARRRRGQAVRPAAVSGAGAGDPGRGGARGAGVRRVRRVRAGGRQGARSVRAGTARLVHAAAERPRSVPSAISSSMGWASRRWTKASGTATCGSNPCCAARSCTTCTRRCWRSAATRNANRISKQDLAWLRDRTNERLEVLRHEMPPPSDDVFERESAGFPGRRRAVPEGRVRGRRRPDADRLRGVVRPGAGRGQQRAARAGGADRHRPRERPAVPPRGTNRPHRSDRSRRRSRSSTTRPAATSRRTGKGHFPAAVVFNMPCTGSRPWSC